MIPPVSSKLCATSASQASQPVDAQFCNDVSVTAPEIELESASNRGKKRMLDLNQKPLEPKKFSDDKFLGTLVRVHSLEKRGHINPEFREKFFTWYSLNCTEEEKTVVHGYIKTLEEDRSLAGQLMHSFDGRILGSKQAQKRGY